MFPELTVTTVLVLFVVITLVTGGFTVPKNTSYAVISLSISSPFHCKVTEIVEGFKASDNAGAINSAGNGAYDDTASPAL